MMYDPIDNFLAQRPLLVLDGALATELERRGADLHDPLWSAKCLIECPDLIREVHLDYFRAGADVATTATYQASFAAFGRRNIGVQAAAHLMRGAVALAAAARDDFWSDEANRIGRLRPLVAASVGPYGAMLADGSEYRGHYAVDDTALADFHRPRLQVLADAGADLLACETIPCLREARVLANLLQEMDACAWISFSCRDGAQTCEGDDIGACAAALDPYPGIAAVGVNCTPPRFVSLLLLRMHAATGKPLAAYPNSGECYNASSRRWTDYSAASAAFGDGARHWLAAGAKLIGGCCRTGPDDIREVKRCTQS